MVVILLNPNQQLLLNNFQSDFIKLNFNYCTKILKNYQTMIPLNFFNDFPDFPELKSISNSIKNIIIYEPEIKPFSSDFSIPFYNQKSKFEFSLASKIELTFDDKIHFFDFPLVFFNLKDGSKGKFLELNKKIGTNIFPLNIKVFRIGKCLCQNNSFILEDSLWKKLK
ncbi:MAG: hypothetical protein IJZ27_06050 [Treponema sp.]|nr:hypothetical protein [Treponema sp.]